METKKVAVYTANIYRDMVKETQVVCEERSGINKNESNSYLLNLRTYFIL